MSKASPTDVQELLKYLASQIQEVTSLPPVTGTPKGFVVLSDPANPSNKGLYLYVGGQVLQIVGMAGGANPTIVNNVTTIVTTPAGGTSFVYMKKQVQITGTLDSPEVFTTGSGKLATCDAPNGSYPTFDSTKRYSLIINGQIYQDCTFNVTSDVAVSGGSLTFSVAASIASGSTGTPQADIIIIAVPK